MTVPTFKLADPIADRAALLDINIEYVAWVFAGIEQAFGVRAVDILGSEARDYVPTVIDKVCGDAPPRGVFYLIEDDGVVVGMGGLRRLADGVAELKRVYVRPSQRGKGLGELILRRILDDARAFGYRCIRLDSAPFMKSAQALYRAKGFVERASYAGVEVPEAFHANWSFMELEI